MIELTIGMACHNDWNGVFFTVQALRLYHADLMPRCEILVVDNDPAGRQGAWTRNLIENWTASKHADPAWPEPGAVRYIAAPEVEGTAAPRDRVMREAAGRYVLCIDCHVLLFPGALGALLGYYRDHPDTSDLLSGPIFMDDLDSYATHFDDVWRGDMWGIWARAWRCTTPGCRWLFCPREVATPGGGNGPFPAMVYAPLLPGGRAPVPKRYGPHPELHCPECNRIVPIDVGWWGHETHLERAGFGPVGRSPNDPPFEIPAMGLGLFSCRKNAWQGFNPDFRGFGGEEWYIHEKFRRAGARCLCLPALRWAHRFTREGQAIPYQLNRWNVLRNYVIGHREVGLDLSRLYDQFVSRGGFPQDQWEQALAGATWPRGHEVQIPFEHARRLEGASA